METELFDFKFRVQLVCKRVGQDTYFAKYKGRDVFVKGPYENERKILPAMQILELKRYFDGIEGILIEIVYAVPNRWPEGTPLGIRNSMTDRMNKKRVFMVCDDMNKGNYNLREHKSKLWPLTRVVDLNKGETVIPLDFNVVNESLMLNCFYLFIVGIPDVAKLNFLFDKETEIVYGIDEDSFDKDVNFVKGFGKKNCEKVQNYIRENEEELKVKLRKWKVSLEENKNEIDNLIKIRKNMEERINELLDSNLLKLFD